MAIFDTLRAAQRLRDEADQPSAAAETIAAVIGEAVAPGRDDVMALREDVGGLRTELHDEVGALRADMAVLRGELREGLQSMRTEMQAMRTEMQAMRADFQSDMRTLTLQLFGIAVGVATVAVAIVKLT